MNKYLQALIHSILFFGAMHLALLSLYALSTGQWEVLNAFYVLDINLFLPHLGKGKEYFILSWLLVGVVYIAILVQETNTMKKK